MRWRRPVRGSRGCGRRGVVPARRRVARRVQRSGRTEPAEPAGTSQASAVGRTSSDRTCPRLDRAQPRDDGLPDLELPCLEDGPAVNLADLRGTPTVLNVWAAWCTNCDREMPLFADAMDRAGDRVRFFGVHYKATRDAGPRLRGRLRRAVPVGPRRRRRPDRRATRGLRAAADLLRRGRRQGRRPQGRRDHLAGRAGRAWSSSTWACGCDEPPASPATPPADLPGWLRPLADAARAVRPEDLSRFLPPEEGGRESAVLMLFAGDEAGGAGRRGRAADRALARDAQPRRPGRVPRRRDRPGATTGRSGRRCARRRRRPGSTRPVSPSSGRCRRSSCR